MAEIEKSALTLDLPPISRRLKLITTAAVYLGNIAFGCAFTIYGPALVDLKNKYETDTATISIVFTVVTISYLFGALGSVLIYKYVHRQLGTVMILTGMALTMYFAPILPTMILFFASGAILGFTCGAYDATQIVWIMEIWQDKAGPFIQAQHFFYALGSFLPSFVLAPFLSKEPDEVEGMTTTTEESTVNATEKLVTPFIIIGGFVTVAAATQLLLFIFARYRPPPPEVGRLDAKPIPDLTFDPENNNIEKPVAALRNWYKLKLILLAAIFLGASQGMEICTNQFLSTYAQDGKLALTGSEAAYVLAGLTGAYTVGRGLGIVIILRFPPQIILCINLVLITAGSFILLFFGDESRTLLWTGAIVLGAGFSTMFASFSAFIERHLFFTNMVGAFMLVSGSLVASIYPLIVSRLIDDYPSVITYTVLFSVFWCTVALAVASKMVYSRQKAVQARKKEQSS